MLIGVGVVVPHEAEFVAIAVAILDGFSGACVGGGGINFFAIGEGALQSFGNFGFGLLLLFVCLICSRA